MSDQVLPASLEHEIAGLTEDVLQHPDDMAPRLILADWMEDNIPQFDGREKARHIRLQIEQSYLVCNKRPELGPIYLADLIECRCPSCREFEKLYKEIDLLERIYLGKWSRALADLSGWKSDIVYRRGFVEEIRTNYTNFIQISYKLFSNCPIRKVYLSDVNPWFNRTTNRYTWHEGETAGNMTVSQRESCLSKAVYRHLSNDKKFPYSNENGVVRNIGVHLSYTAKEAVDDLSDALVAFGRERADLTV